jgi:uncharacterized protein with ATP-grasp and redox domains
MPRTIAHSKKDKRTIHKKQADFLAQFCELANVTQAAKKARVGRRTVYDWLQTDIPFKKEYKKATKIAIGVLEDEAARRAISGTDKPIFYKGKKVATVKEYSDTLLIVLLKAQKPKKYKDRFQGELTGKGGKALIPGAAPVVNVYNVGPPLAASETEIDA